MYSIFNFKKYHWFFSEPTSAFIYFKSCRMNLLNGRYEKFNLTQLKKRLSSIDLVSFQKKPIVIHCYYELGFLFNSLNDLIPDDEVLMIEIHYQKAEKIALSNFTQSNGIDLVRAPSIDFNEYREKFNQGYQHLLNGNCYQFNLTNIFNFTFKSSVNELDFINTLFSNQEKLAPFAHATFLSPINELIISNTPECLFKIKRGKIYSYPIKGTLPFNNKLEDKNSVWNKLKKSKKNRAELYIIIDLIRNDLSKIEKTINCVVNKRKLLVVPKIVHQFAKISTDLNKNTNLFKIMYALFPGGSITGAPKKRVMQIINQLEEAHRGFYTGSTVLIFKKHRVASINIRSALINLEDKTLKYGAGGGITLLSKIKSEFNEMELKLASFTEIFKRN